MIWIGRGCRFQHWEISCLRFLPCFCIIFTRRMMRHLERNGDSFNVLTLPQKDRKTLGAISLTNIKE